MRLTIKSLCHFLGNVILHMQKINMLIWDKIVTIIMDTFDLDKIRTVVMDRCHRFIPRSKLELKSKCFILTFNCFDCNNRFQFKLFNAMLKIKKISSFEFNII